VIVYCDTSALVKCYCREAESDGVLRLRRSAEATAICVIGHAEFHSALNRKRREGHLSEGDGDRVLSGFGLDWEGLVRVDVSPELSRIAARLLRAYPLRAFDALHLAAAVLLRGRLRSAEVVFAGFDERQCQAAVQEGLAVFPPLP
jgi:predicted nucleic acid-binding protein